MKKNVLKNKTVVITGATKGIGEAIFNAYKNENVEIIVTGRNLKRKKIDKIQYFPLDLKDKKSIIVFVNYLKTKNRIDILINNAGINIISEFTDIKKKDWDDVLAVNLTGPMLIAQTVAKIMKKNGGGHILNISSIWGIIGKEKRHAYSAAKTGLIGLTKTMALELAKYNILVNALCPGFTVTKLTESILSKKEIKELSCQIPLGRFATVNEIAQTAIFLCSNKNSYITGQAIVIDGGFTVK